MRKSIMQEEKQCYFCRRTNDLDKHHCIHGTANRKLADKDGLWVWICKDCHTMSSMAVHNNAKQDLVLKIQAQMTWEEVYGNRQEFIQRYGKSYI